MEKKELLHSTLTVDKLSVFVSSHSFGVLLPGNIDQALPSSKHLFDIPDTLIFLSFSLQTLQGSGVMVLGNELGYTDGNTLGKALGNIDGFKLGIELGIIDGSTVAITLGILLGINVGAFDDTTEGNIVGTILGDNEDNIDGIVLGFELGT